MRQRCECEICWNAEKKEKNSSEFRATGESFIFNSFQGWSYSNDASKREKRRIKKQLNAQSCLNSLSGRHECESLYTNDTIIINSGNSKHCAIWLIHVSWVFTWCIIFNLLDTSFMVKVTNVTCSFRGYISLSKCNQSQIVSRLLFMYIILSTSCRYIT